MVFNLTFHGFGIRFEPWELQIIDFLLFFHGFFCFRGFQYKCLLWMDSGANLAPFWCGLGSQNSSWERLGASWRRLGGMLGRLGSVLELLGGVLGVSWGVLGASWAVLEASWARLGSILDCLLYTSPSPRDSRKSRMPSSA